MTGALGAPSQRRGWAAAATPLNLPGEGGDQRLVPLRHRGGKSSFRGRSFMKTIRPDNPDPIPLRRSPHRMVTIMIRFVGLLALAVVVLTLLWSR